MFISESNKKALLRRVILYFGITLFIVVFGIVYEHFSHNVYSFHMYFAWIWVLGFGLIPYSLLFVLPIKYMPGSLAECIYNFGVAMLTVRSIFIGVIDIYGTSSDSLITLYTILAIVSLVVGFSLYTGSMLLDKIQNNN